MRTVVVGIDGFSPVFLDRYLERRELPALGRLAREGSSTPLISTLPATTPVAWTTAVTGAPPSVTGIEGFLLHRPGCQPDNRVSGCYADRCRAEPLWETAERGGLRSYVVKFPVSYPSGTPTLRVDGAAGWGGLRCLHEVAPSAVADTGETGGRSSHVVIGDRREDGWTGELRIPLLWNDDWVEVPLAVRAANGKTVVSLDIGSDGRRELAAGWSEPITLLAVGRRGAQAGAFRIKVLAAAADPPALRLAHTPLHEIDGHCSNEQLWGEMLPEVGPIEEQTEPALLFEGQLDLESQMEIFELNTRWLGRCCDAVLARRNCDLLILQTHIVDWAHHALHGGVDPRHPDFDAERAPTYEVALLRAYRLADSLVGGIANRLGPEDNLVVLGDHGQDLHHTTLHTNRWLAEQGLLTWSEDGGVDWLATRVYATGNFLHLNQSGREPYGIVNRREGERLIAEVCTALQALSDPRTGETPVLTAAPKAAFRRLGADGAGMGDALFCCRSGYQAHNGRGPVLEPTRLLRQFTSGHDHFWPLDPRIHTRLFVHGPAFRSGVHLDEPRWLGDFAPTLSSALGIEAPRDAVGSPIAPLVATRAGRAQGGQTQAGTAWGEVA